MSKPRNYRDPDDDDDDDEEEDDDDDDWLSDYYFNLVRLHQERIGVE